MAKRISNKRKVTFTCNAPGAKSVALAGDFTDWDKSPIPMKKQLRGHWSVTVSLEPGTYQYRLLVDGQWQDDPECSQRVPNCFGTQNCVRVVA